MNSSPRWLFISWQFLSVLSLRDRGPWQFSVAHLLVMFLLASIICYSIASQSVMAVSFCGGGIALGLLAVGAAYRNKAALTAGFCFALLTAGVILFGYYACASRGIGQPTIPVLFEIVNARTRLPIAGATVRIRNVYSSPGNWPPGEPTSVIPQGEEGAESATDSNGLAIVPYAFSSSTTADYWRSSQRVFVNAMLHVTVIAPGYTPNTAPFYVYTGTYVDLTGNAPTLPHVVLYLEPAPADANGAENEGHPQENP